MLLCVGVVNVVYGAVHVLKSKSNSQILLHLRRHDTEKACSLIVYEQILWINVLTWQDSHITVASLDRSGLSDRRKYTSLVLNTCQTSAWVLGVCSLARLLAILPASASAIPLQPFGHIARMTLLCSSTIADSSQL